MVRDIVMTGVKIGEHSADPQDVIEEVTISKFNKRRN